MQFAYPKALRSGAFAYVFCIFAVIFEKLFGNAENNQNCNLGPISRFWKNHAFARKSCPNVATKYLRSLVLKELTQKMAKNVQKTVKRTWKA